jgi:DNA-binding beta-propeller fold protein YncE
MKPRERTVSGLLLVLFSVMLAAASEQELRRPVAMDKISSGDLFVLGLSGNLYRLRTQPGGMSLIGQTRLPNTSSPVDLTSAKLNGVEVLFVSYNTEKFGAVSSYSLDGKVNRTWWLRSGASGLDVDYVTQTLYVASSDSGEISSIDLKGGDGVPKHTASIRDAQKLGPLVLNVPRKMLYVADVESGNVYEVNLADGKTRLLVPKAGIPQAMLVLEDRNILLLADSVGRKIYSVQLGVANARPTVLAALPPFRSPSGLARLARDQIAVSDDATGKIFVLALDGKLLYSFPSK